MEGMGFFLGGIVALVLAAVASRAKGLKLAEVLGFDRRNLWSYRDSVLATVASIATLLAIVAFAQPSNDFDRRVAVACSIIAIVCCTVSPNRLVIFGTVAGFVAVQGWFAVIFSKDARSYWVAVPATAVAIAIFRIFGKRPLQGPKPPPPPITD